MARTFASGDHIYYGDAPIAAWATGTVAFRFKHTGTAVMTMMSLDSPGSTSYGFDILANPFSVGRVFVEAFNNSTARVQIASNPTPPSNDGNWHHLAYVWDTASGGLNTFYLDGASVGTANSSSGWTVGAVSFPARIQLADDTTGFYSDYAGSLADFGLWSNAQLNADEVAALAKGYPAHLIRPTSLEMHVPLVRDTRDLRGRAVSAIVGTTVSDHPRVIGGAV